MAYVRDILAGKDQVIHIAPPHTSVLDAVRKMNRHRIGALVVVERGAVIGMFTERDVLRLVGSQRDPATVRLFDVMTHDVVVGSPSLSLDEVGTLMTRRRIRHLPICDATGRLIGLVSIGDLNAYHAVEQEQTIAGLSEYILGRA